jgi:hypothetical protein
MQNVLTYHLSRLILPLNQRIMNKCIKDAHKGVFVIAENLHCDFARDTKDSFDASDAKTVNKILCEPERNTFGSLQRLALNACG